MNAVDEVAVVGREVERGALCGLPDILEQGAAAFVIQGSAGIGKTTLWSYGLRAVADRARVLVARPGNLEPSLSYSGLADLLGPLHLETIGLTGEQLTILRHALRIQTLGSQAVRHADVAMAATAALGLATRVGPVVLAVDDLQWLDRSSARVLAHALRRLRSEPLGVLASRRGTGAIELFAGAITPDRVALLDLTPLSQAETDALIRLKLAAALLRPVLGQIHQTSGGNPMYALELARALLLHPHPLSSGSPLPVPGGLLELVGRRLAVLAPSTLEMVLVVAMADRPTVELVQSVLGHSAGAGLQRAADAGLIESERGILRFTHPLLAAACYSEAGVPQRRRLHLRLADIATDVEDRARHLAEGTDLADEAVAMVIDAGADAAHARGAPDAAAVLGERALDLTPSQDRQAVLRRSLSAADAFWEAGECARLEEILHPLLSEFPAGSGRAQVLHRLGVASVALHSWPAARSLLTDALSEVGTDNGLRAAIERDLAFGMMQAEDLLLAAGHIAAMATLAKTSTDVEQAADAEAWTAMYGVIRGDSPPSDDLLGTVRRLAAPPRRPTGTTYRGVASRAVLMAAVLKWTDDFTNSRRILDRVQQELWAGQEDGLLLPVLFQLGELECWAGQMEKADALAELARETCARSGLNAFNAMWLYLKALTAARTGAAEDARAAARTSLAISLETGDARHQMRAHAVAGFVDLSIGDAESAVHHLGRVWSLERSCGYGHPGVIRAAGDEIEALLVLGRHDEAAARLAFLHESSVRSASRWGGAVAMRSQGLLEAAAGDVDSAVETLRASLALHERLPDPLEHGRALLALASVLRRTNQKAEARRLLTTASARFAECNAGLWKSRSDLEKDRMRGRADSHGGLTPMESQMALLVSAGHSNRELARELSVSVKTVESHLTSIYRKLGLRSRTELASHLLSPREPPAS